MAHLVEHDISHVRRFVPGSQAASFIDYMNSRWLVPPDYTNIDQYRIWRDADKQEIVHKAKRAKLIGTNGKPLTFIRVVRTLREYFGYNTEDGRAEIDGTRRRYKLVVSYDKNQVTYRPIKKPIGQ